MVLKVLGNVAGNLSPDAFQKGALDEIALQQAQRSEQARLNRLRADRLSGGEPKLPEVTALDQGSTGLRLDNFGGQYVDVPPPSEDKTAKTESTTEVEQEKITPDGTLPPSSNVIIPNPNVTFPAVDPDKIDLPTQRNSRGRQKTTSARSAEIKRRKTIELSRKKGNFFHRRIRRRHS